MPTGRKMAEALAEGKAMRAKQREEREKKIARAVSDVLDGTCESIRDAARGIGVAYEAVRAAVNAERERRAKAGGS